MKTALILLVFTGCIFTVHAQDQIIRRNGNVIHCKVRKIGSEEITYSQAEIDPVVEFSIEKSKVEKIIFGTGKELLIDYKEAARETAEMNSEDLFQVQNLNAFKLNVWSIMFGTTAIAYERALQPGRSFEADMGIIGLGFDNADEGPGGIGLKAGYKFILSPHFYLRRMRYAHILKGPYIKPEVTFASYHLRSENQQVSKGAIFLTIGEQTVISDKFLFDSFFSFGYGFTNAGGFDNWPYYFGVVGDGFPLSGTFGFRIGLLF